jgi:hypothetical protein
MATVFIPRIYTGVPGTDLAGDERDFVLQGMYIELTAVVVILVIL